MIPYCILVIEDDDDRAFMEQLFVEYHRLMYHEIFKLVHDQWAAEDVMQSTLVRLIDKIPELRIKDRNHLVNYIITASKNQARNYLRDSGRHSTSDLQEFIGPLDRQHGALCQAVCNSRLECALCDVYGVGSAVPDEVDRAPG